MIQDNKRVPHQMEKITTGRFILGIKTLSSASFGVTHALRTKHYEGEDNVMN